MLFESILLIKSSTFRKKSSNQRSRLFASAPLEISVILPCMQLERCISSVSLDILDIFHSLKQKAVSARTCQEIYPLVYGTPSQRCISCSALVAYLFCYLNDKDYELFSYSMKWINMIHFPGFIKVKIVATEERDSIMQKKKNGISMRQVVPNKEAY